MCALLDDGRVHAAYFGSQRRWQGSCFTASRRRRTAADAVLPSELPRRLHGRVELEILGGALQLLGDGPGQAGQVEALRGPQSGMMSATIESQVFSYR